MQHLENETTAYEAVENLLWTTQELSNPEIKGDLQLYYGRKTREVMMFRKEIKDK